MFAALLDHFPRLILFVPLAVGVLFQHHTELDRYTAPFRYKILSSNLERCRLCMCVNVTYVAYGDTSSRLFRRRTQESCVFRSEEIQTSECLVGIAYRTGLISSVFSVVSPSKRSVGVPFHTFSHTRLNA